MAIPEDLRATVFTYCKETDSPESLPAMTVAWDTAEAYLRGAGISRPALQSARHGLWLGVILPLTLDAYDQREAQVESGKLSENPAWRCKLNQLKWTEKR